LFVGTLGLRRFTPQALEYLATIPTITLDAPSAQIPWTPTVRFTTATYGIHSQGTGYRMDEVPIPLKAVLPTSYPTDADVLQRLSPLRVREFFA
jgi:formylmethanofuran dehydrogenase subunit B